MKDECCQPNTTWCIPYLLVLCLAFSICGGAACNSPVTGDNKPIVVCTTTMIADLAKNLAADRFHVVPIMKPGEDPHIYSPKPLDALNIRKAKVVLRNGLHLEGNLGDIIKNNLASGALNVALAETEAIKPLGSEQYQGAPDPHCWFDVGYFKIYAQRCRDAFIEADPAGKDHFEKAAADYIGQLDKLDSEIKAKIASIPGGRRVLVTSHDAFQYFGRAYDIEVHAVIGVSTEQQARPQDIEDLKNLVEKRGVKAVFIETSVSAALNKIVKNISAATGVKVGGTLYSDSLGDENSSAPTYLDMIRYNVDTIVEALR